MPAASRPKDDGMGPMVTCPCGCEATFRLFDDRKRQRTYATARCYPRYIEKLYYQARRETLRLYADARQAARRRR